ncbi:tryptophan--tRNA ligase [Candidatus Curtissbacteria bacterium]|nr:tryptophan--tRNA ligase [Candidatus Curtissbacteria bacterium]
MNKSIVKKRILTGDRPTGRLHLGHYVGSLRNRVRLQDEYECFFIIADLHTLTTRPGRTEELKENIKQLVLDYLSVGIDPKKATIYVQSQIPEAAELAVIFGNLTTVPRLERVPTLKDVMRDSHIQIPSFGLLGYPVLQAADILMVRANLVPVGRDQASHIEVTREIAREFNKLYGVHIGKSTPGVNELHTGSVSGGDGQVFPIPEALIPEDIGTLPGTDGKAKMSKSVGNVINLSDDSETVKKQVMGMYTDPKRVHGDEPGNVENNPVFIYLDAFSQSEKSKSKVKELKDRYKNGTVKDVEVKEFLVQVLEEFLQPLRGRREEYEKQPELVEKILKEGTESAREEAKKTLSLVRAAMKIEYF